MSRGRLASLVPIAAFLALPASAAPGPKDDLDRIRESGVLRWGADAERGGPLVYDDRNDPSRQEGFEVEIAEDLARRLGVRAELAQNNWAELVPGLERGDFSIALNGLEITDYREKEIDFTR